MMMLSKYEEIRRKIEERLLSADRHFEPDEYPTKGQIQTVLSIINDVFDPCLPQLLECCMCGAKHAFEIDEDDPSTGYCYAEKQYYTIQPGPNAPQINS